MFDDQVKAVISDYNWIDEDISKTWIGINFKSFIIYDKYHRNAWNNNNKIIRQKNVGQNVYDMLDYIVNNYEKLDGRTFFARGCLIFPKGRKKPLSNGNCYEKNLWSKFDLKEPVIEVHDYSYQDVDGYFNKIEGKAYFEKIDNWWFRFHPGKYYFSFTTFLKDLYGGVNNKKYIRFSPGVSYIVHRDAILQYPKQLYINLRFLVSWGCVVGEAHTLERAMYELLSSKREISDFYLLETSEFKKKLKFRRYQTFCWNCFLRPLYLLWTKIRTQKE